MDPATHKRFLDYRERAAYFRKRGTKDLTQDEFEAAEAEYRALAAKGDSRDDEEDARFAELAKVLYRD
jgi:hypothetical protein